MEEYETQSLFLAASTGRPPDSFKDSASVLAPFCYLFTFSHEQVKGLVMRGAPLLFLWGSLSPSALFLYSKHIDL